MNSDIKRSDCAYYFANVSAFLVESVDSILGVLAANSRFSDELDQKSAWLSQIEILQDSLKGLSGQIFLEFVIPRIGSRVDAVLVSGPIVFVIEFKVGERQVKRADLNQVWDYALDLKNFHKGSHSVVVVPILVATKMDSFESATGRFSDDKVAYPRSCNSSTLAGVLRSTLRVVFGDPINARDWMLSAYEPTPTIIEAAQALFAKHSVENIARHDAGAKNLSVTSDRIEHLIDHARAKREKLVILVTGVPGAGKTLVGLNVATKRRDRSQDTHAVFLSGNGPLVAVLSEALTRDELARQKRRSLKARKGDVQREVKAFIQNVHHFRDDGLRFDGPPSDHVVIFDEAQRAWDREKTAAFMARKKRRSGFDQSEPEFLISYMNRHEDWAVVICLVGGGQEIHDGEAGISAWLDAIRERFPSWHVYVSPKLVDSEYSAVESLEKIGKSAHIVYDESLHLSVSMRSFRASTVSAFVKAIIDRDSTVAEAELKRLLSRYPIALTRDLVLAKKWLRDQARGSERFGIVASSGAQRLKPHAIDIRFKVDPVHWFLDPPEDTRSSYFLEDVATEFQVQGLELDWVCVTWDADLRCDKSGWLFHSFMGSRWTTVRKSERKRYLCNAYRVLLTRARQGMIIFVPQGDETDASRLPEHYDSTFNYLASTGIPVVS